MPTRPPAFQAAGKFGERVRSRRQQLGLSQEALADRSGLHWTYIGSVERGQRNIALHNIVKIASALDVDPGTLVSSLKP